MKVLGVFLHVQGWFLTMILTFDDVVPIPSISDHKQVRKRNRLRSLQTLDDMRLGPGAVVVVDRWTETAYLA